MKETFRKAGVEVARGRVVQTIGQARKLIQETGFPVVAKPDIGVGAAKTYKIHTDTELVDFFASKPQADYIMEEFVDGTICSYDGLANDNGDPVFVTGHQYSSGIMETVNNDELIYYYSLRSIPKDLEEAGQKVLSAFNVRGRFFHLEFFRRKSDNKIVALEVNMRPPGGLTTDMFNFANDIDIYAEWANIIVHNQFRASYSRPYHCAYISRKSNRQYKHGHDELIGLLGKNLVHYETISGVFSAALGDQGYLVRTPDLDEVHSLARIIQE
jgi:biotin carboxylase